ncbi:hypothetical protein ULMS_26460 [Patiriisocius marinistellae]|uniref:HTH LytTR-type domain-containing protein n=1 Tax=Patiriisocius marinistellae TaxID=2494560 RepID=A0A5J4G0C0_9FLAO|nr:LytTR family DNA-binding domain-containing protein [Patiriisocius marinistellae]GEQ87138.1 hypothetical protein ULMS_26460 [Patiriisocius marinistellae]
MLKSISRLDASIDCTLPIETANFSFFKCDRKLVKVDFETIKFIESCGDYIKLYLEDKVVITRETMKDIMKKLPQKIFVRVHRSFIISIDKMESFTNEEIIIDKKSIPISRTYKSALMKKLNITN